MPARIDDQFTKLPIGRERKRQLRRMAAGICLTSKCRGKPVKWGWCQKCAALKRIALREYHRVRYGYRRRNTGSRSYQE